MFPIFASEKNESPTKNIFGSFTAFNKTPTTSTAFSFLNNITTSKDTSAVNGVNNSAPNIFKQPRNIDNSSMFKGTENNTLNNKMDEEYYAKLKDLNETVSSCIMKHVDTKPYRNLKPILEAYEEFFDELVSLIMNKVKSMDSLMNKICDVSYTFKKELSSSQFKSADVSKDVMKETATSSLGASSPKESITYAKLNGLNETVSSWIKKLVDTKPYRNLKPIFEAYEEFFDELVSLIMNKVKSMDSLMNKICDVSYTFKKELSSSQFKSADVSKDVMKETATSSLGASSPKESITSVTTAPMFAFGSTSTKTITPSLSFGSGTKTSSSSSFVLGSPATKPFTFFNASQPTNNEEANDDNEGEPPKVEFTPVVKDGHTYTVRCKVFAKNQGSFGDRGVGSPATKPFTFFNASQPTNNEEATDDNEGEPPKVEFTPVVKDGHTYTVRCKVFVKNQGSFGDRGVGTLYLKPVPDSEKTQLIVRADTKLENVLCNFILSKSIPLKRMGEKDVMLVWLPTFESKPPPVPILLRVKSPEQADELFSQLEKHQK